METVSNNHARNLCYPLDVRGDRYSALAATDCMRVITPACVAHVPRVVPRANLLHASTSPPHTLAPRAALVRRANLLHANTSARPTLIFPGGGIFFWWQAGAVSELQRRFDLQGANTAGASAGALAATLTACDSDMEHALDVAFRLCQEAGVWERGKWGLFGIWGQLVDDWLEELLPADADARCGGRVRVAINAAPELSRPYLEPRLVERYSSRRDLIEANLASVHVPLFLDKSLTAGFRGGRYVDGSIRWGDRLGWRRMLPPDDAPFLRLSSASDKRMRAKYAKPQDFLALTTREGVGEMMAWGAEHVEALDADGGLRVLDGLRR